MGFDLRGDGALLHLRRDEILALRYDSLPQLLGVVPRVEIRRPPGETQLWPHASTDWAAQAEPDPRQAKPDPRQAEPDPRRAELDRSCELAPYVNGSRLERRMSDDLTVMFPPRSLSAIEIFDGEWAPVGAPEACGAVLLWR